ncbi:MAG TPA: hypothetical protein VF902_03030 [Coriobacteriia bacterium]
MSEHEDMLDGALLDLEHKANEELRSLLAELSAEERNLSYRRRVLHGRIDILRAELVRRLKDQRSSGGDVISGADIEKLIEILASDLRGTPLIGEAGEGGDDDEDV